MRYKRTLSFRSEKFEQIHPHRKFYNPKASAIAFVFSRITLGDFYHRVSCLKFISIRVFTFLIKTKAFCSNPRASSNALLKFASSAVEHLTPAVARRAVRRRTPQQSLESTRQPVSPALSKPRMNSPLSTSWKRQTGRRREWRTPRRRKPSWTAKMCSRRLSKRLPKR